MTSTRLDAWMATELYCLLRRETPRGYRQKYHGDVSKNILEAAIKQAVKNCGNFLKHYSRVK